jgi:CheY-like chemotaxis protein
MVSEKKRGTILIVDDTPSNIAVISDVLTGLYKTKIATNGEKALALANAAEKPDLILLDIMMPEMDGFEVCRRLKASPATADIPVIFLTAKTEVEDETLGFDVGAVDYIHKPFSPPIIKARVKTQMALREALQRSEELLEVVLPRPAADEIRKNGTVAPRRYDQVAVLFCDLANFTSYCDQHEPEAVVSQLDLLVGRFEKVVKSHGMEKIKTIGDAFMAAGNLLYPNADPVGSAVRCGLEMAEMVTQAGLGWAARVGVNIGPVVAGVVGAERYQFDIWGDTVNVAARMTGRGSPGTVAVTEDVWKMIESQFVGVSLDRQEIKGKGGIIVYEIRSIR